ncbi:MAG: hypothetical protein HQL07_17085 [Nitrospirae bacterium]|nr:hypothetical protein [Magnetococcales bacterium]HAT49311.1 hypothetical protein [Alphaproteobacteria bacterium]
MDGRLMEGADWDIDLLGKTATHLPTGLTIRFAAALDGSGAMTADLVNPERLEGVGDEILRELPYRAWQVYAECSERALAVENY